MIKFSLLVCILSLLIGSSVAFQIDYDSSTCNALKVATQISPQELNTTTGMVLQFTQSRNLSDPALFNTTLAWTDFVPYETYEISSLLPAYQIGNKYYSTNISMTDAMNSSWVGSGYDQEYHTIMWLYIQPENTTDVRSRIPYGGPGNPFVPTSQARPLCSAFYSINGTRTDFNPNLINSGSSSGSSSNTNNSDGLSKGAKAGLIVGCIIGTLLLLAIVAILAFVFLSAVRGMVKACLSRRRRRARFQDTGVFNGRSDEEDRHTTFPKHLSDDNDVIKGKQKDERTTTAQNTQFTGIFDALDRTGSQDADAITPVHLPSHLRNAEDEAPPPTYAEANQTNK